jgi:two-component system response regulator AtoC
MWRSLGAKPDRRRLLELPLARVVVLVRRDSMSVLIVDDQPEILAMLEDHFRAAEIPWKSASSAVQALRLHRGTPFPVVLSDIKMPGMTGVEMMREIKRIYPTCIIYVMTGFPTLAGLVECLEAGAVDYFVKPFPDLEVLLSSMREALTRHERWRSELSAFKR